MKLSRRERKAISEQYPSLAFLIVHPEVGPILKRAVSRTRPLSADEFRGQLKATDWYKSSEERSKLYGPEPEGET